MFLSVDSGCKRNILDIFVRSMTSTVFSMTGINTVVYVISCRNFWLQYRNIQDGVPNKHENVIYDFAIVFAQSDHLSRNFNNSVAV